MLLSNLAAQLTVVGPRDSVNWDYILNWFVGLT